MKVVVAIDSMKGSLSSRQASEAAARGILAADPKAETAVCPVADGGEGTVEAMTEALGGTFRTMEVTGPLGLPVLCTYGLVPERKTAIIEMAQASGLPLVPPERRNPMETTTRGVGEVIRDAVRLGSRKLIIGIGGSATNDGGAGMLQALGFSLLDGSGRQIPPGAKGLKLLKEIRREKVLPGLSRCQILVACDVTNPLCGPLGCSRIFGPQKGADEAMITQMDGLLERYARIAGRLEPSADPDFPGAGAAGGMGFALKTFLGARLAPGIRIVLEETGIEEQIREADLVITGEGRLDGQTAMGKTPAGVAALAKKYKKPVAALGGSVGCGAGECLSLGIDAMFSILREPMSLKEAMDPETAAGNIQAAAEQVFRLWRLGRQSGKEEKGCSG